MVSSQERTVISTGYLPAGRTEKLTLYVLPGREVAVLVHAQKPAGSYEVSFDRSGLASGVYVVPPHSRIVYSVAANALDQIIVDLVFVFIN